MVEVAEVVEARLEVLVEVVEEGREEGVEVSSGAFNGRKRDTGAEGNRDLDGGPASTMG